MSQAKKKLREDNRIDNWAYLWMAMFTAAGFLLFNILYSFFGAFVLKILVQRNDTGKIDFRLDLAAEHIQVDVSGLGFVVNGVDNAGMTRH